jgi:hypothetical protein
MYDLEVQGSKYISNGILSHNTTTYTCYALHQAIFRPDTTIAIVSNKGSSARAILSRIKLAYENLPKYIQMGVKTWNHGNIELDNGSSIIAMSTASDALRGYSINTLICDEAAYIDNWDQFWASIAPTISSGKTSSIILVSTYNGENHFYQMIEEAKEDKNGFHFFQVDYTDVPGRDQKWADEMLSQLGEENFKQEILNIPTSIENSLLSAKGMQFLKRSLKKPVESTPTTRIYELPNKNRNYFATVDVADTGHDASVIAIFDVTEVPYRMVAIMQNKIVTHIGLADLIYDFCSKYFFCPVLIESNDFGRTTLHILNYTLEYPNIISTKRETQKSFSNQMGQIQMGLRQTSKTKNLGCQRIKFYIETEKIIIPDKNTYEEFKHFKTSGSSYSAENGKTDDCVMACVLMAYFTATKSFRVQFPTILEDASRKDIKKEIYESDLISSPIFANFMDEKQTDEDTKWLLT